MQFNFFTSIDQPFPINFRRNPHMIVTLMTHELTHAPNYWVSLPLRIVGVNFYAVLPFHSKRNNEVKLPW